MTRPSIGVTTVGASWAWATSATTSAYGSTTIEMADEAGLRWGNLSIFNCSNKEMVSGKANIVCFFVLTQTKYDQRDYEVKSLIWWKPRLIDNLGIEHEFVTLYLINRRGQQQESMNIAKGESAWFVAEFADGGDPAVNSARVMFMNLPKDPQLHAPVKPLE